MTRLLPSLPHLGFKSLCALVRQHLTICFFPCNDRFFLGTSVFLVHWLIDTWGFAREAFNMHQIPSLAEKMMHWALSYLYPSPATQFNIGNGVGIWKSVVYMCDSESETVAIYKVGGAQRHGWWGALRFHFLYFLQRSESFWVKNHQQVLGSNDFKLPATTHNRELGPPDRDVKGWRFIFRTWKL